MTTCPKSQPTDFSPPSNQDLPTEKSKPNQQVEVLFVVNASVGHMAPRGDGIRKKHPVVATLGRLVGMWHGYPSSKQRGRLPVIVADDFSDAAG